jgi:hypothetical protein
MHQKKDRVILAPAVLEIAVTKNEDLRIHALDRTITEKKN